MKFSLLKALFLAASLTFPPILNARKYIAERGDTWESVARKWGLYTEELRASNSIFPHLFTGLEIDLPDNAAAAPLSTTAIARLENADRSLELAKEKLGEKHYSSASSFLGTTVALRGRTAAFILYLQGQAKDGLQDYEEALDYYQRASFKASEGDKTLSEEETGNLANRLEIVGTLAAEQRQKREEEEARRREARRREREREIELEQECEAERQASAGNVWSGGWGSPWDMPFSGGWGMPFTPGSMTIAPMPVPTPSFQYTPNWEYFPPVDLNSIPASMPATFPADMGTSFDSSTSSSGNPRNPITFSDHTCSLCGGKGTIVDNGATTFGLDKTKYCSECGRNVGLSHRHIQCPSCGGKGTVRKRD